MSSLAGPDPEALVARLTALRLPRQTAVPALEMLELAAVADGGKPVAVISAARLTGDLGRGVRDVLAGQGLTIALGHMWNGDDELAGCPDWYVSAVQERRRDEPMLFVCRPARAALVRRTAMAQGGLTVDMESGLLGYPLCCVSAQRTRTNLLHRVNAAMILRTAGDDLERRQRFVRAAVALTPGHKDKRRQLEEALNVVTAPYTSINMCDGCVSDPGSAARRLSRDYEALAKRVGLWEPAGPGT